MDQQKQVKEQYIALERFLNVDVNQQIQKLQDLLIEFFEDNKKPNPQQQKALRQINDDFSNQKISQIKILDDVVGTKGLTTKTKEVILQAYSIQQNNQLLSSMLQEEESKQAQQKKILEENAEKIRQYNEKLNTLNNQQKEINQQQYFQLVRTYNDQTYSKSAETIQNELNKIKEENDFIHKEIDNAYENIMDKFENKGQSQQQTGLQGNIVESGNQQQQ